MNTLIRCLNVAYGMVEAAEIEAMQREEEKHGYLGYKLPEEQKNYSKLQQKNVKVTAHRY